MSHTVSECNAEIARLVAAKADEAVIAGARERRAVAERAQERRDTEALLLRIDEAEGYGSEPSFVLSWDEFRLLRRELRRLTGEAEHIDASTVLARTRQVQHEALQAAVLNRRGRKA